MKLDDFLNQLQGKLDSLAKPDERIELAARNLAAVFRCKPEEVAIFSFDPQYNSLAFLWPAPLRESGSVPLAAQHSLVARTAKSRRPMMDNSFAKTRHMHIFEAAGGDAGGGAPIQKIMSVPLEDAGTLKGVVQVSRKGADCAVAGPDFTPNELAVLGQIAVLLARHF